MISVKPNTDAWRLLALVVARPGQLDSEDLGQLLWRPPMQRASGGLAELRAVAAANRAAMAAALDKDVWGDRTKRASDLLHRLQGRGLVERIRPPQPAEDWLDRILRDPADAIVNAADADPEVSPDPAGLRATLLWQLVREPPTTMVAWVGKAPSGNVQRAVADLIDWGLVVPSLRRWPTPEGIAWVGEPR